MKIYFDYIKLIFFVLTIIVALFQLRIKWSNEILQNFVNNVGPYVMPAYFIFVWLIIWYIISYILIINHDEKQDEKDYTLWFIFWIVIGLWLAFTYYFLING